MWVSEFTKLLYQDREWHLCSIQTRTSRSTKRTSDSNDSRLLVVLLVCTSNGQDQGMMLTISTTVPYLTILTVRVEQYCRMTRKEDRDYCYTNKSDDEVSLWDCTHFIPCRVSSTTRVASNRLLIVRRRRHYSHQKYSKLTVTLMML